MDQIPTTIVCNSSEECQTLLRTLINEYNLSPFYYGNNDFNYKNFNSLPGFSLIRNGLTKHLIPNNQLNGSDNILAMQTFDAPLVDDCLSFSKWTLLQEPCGKEYFKKLIEDSLLMSKRK